MRNIVARENRKVTEVLVWIKNFIGCQNLENWAKWSVNFLITILAIQNILNFAIFTVGWVLIIFFQSNCDEIFEMYKKQACFQSCNFYSFFFFLILFKQHYAVSKGLKLKPSFPGKEHLKSKDTKKEKVIKINEMQNYLFFCYTSKIWDLQLGLPAADDKFCQIDCEKYFKLGKKV